MNPKLGQSIGIHLKLLPLDHHQVRDKEDLLLRLQKMNYLLITQAQRVAEMKMMIDKLNLRHIILIQMRHKKSTI